MGLCLLIAALIPQAAASELQEHLLERRPLHLKRGDGSNGRQSIELGERIVGFDAMLAAVCLGDQRRACAVRRDSSSATVPRASSLPLSMIATRSQSRCGLLHVVGRVDQCAARPLQARMFSKI